MSLVSVEAQSFQQRITEKRAAVKGLLERALTLYQGGATGVQVGAALADGIDEILVKLVQEHLTPLPQEQLRLLGENSAMILIGGSGRGELAPYSDVDLLLLYRSSAEEPFTLVTKRVVQDCWDSGLKLGHSLRSLGDALAMVKRDTHFATAVTDARLLWGNQSLFEHFTRKVRQIIKRRCHLFIKEALQAREEERLQLGGAVQQLEPDVKRSQGGLRDLHVIRWIGYAHYGRGDLESLQLRGALSRDEVRLLVNSLDFLMKVRLEMHFHAKGPSDVLIREEQLRISELWQFPTTSGQLPVEKFMREYFQHCTHIMEVMQQFVEKHQPQSLAEKLLQFLSTHRADGMFKIGYGKIDVMNHAREAVARSVESLLRLYLSAMLNDVRPTPELIEYLKQRVPQIPPVLTAESRKLFLEILKRPRNLGATLRSLAEIGLLEKLVPDVAHAHCLLQFNQYHSYTVDEHTYRAIEACQDFLTDPGPVGTAYREIHHKELLHLALLLHDLGKGFEEDHSEVGRRIALRIATRFELPEHQADVLVFLVHKHLQMSHLVFRRNYTDPKLLFEFSTDVGSPETLRMLYVLTAADTSAVGPGVWTEWKAEVISDLYDRALLILSGKRHQFHERERLRRIKEHVLAELDLFLNIPGKPENPREWKDWVEDQLSAFAPHYLTNSSPRQIAGDLVKIRGLQPDGIDVTGNWEAETDVVEYRVITHEHIRSGCFHKIAGALTSKRLEILSAEITTSLDEIIVDRFRVVDNDFEGEIPPERIDEICQNIKRMLLNEIAPENLFRKTRYGRSKSRPPLTKVPSRVVIDNDSSDYCTVIDVFAHDCPGLLYRIAKTLYEMDLSVKLAKISTHLDQVVDVFYVTDPHGHKVRDGERLKEIRGRLLQELITLE